jgi:hypothetical protein
VLTPAEHLLTYVFPLLFGSDLLWATLRLSTREAPAKGDKAPFVDYGAMGALMKPKCNGNEALRATLQKIVRTVEMMPTSPVDPMEVLALHARRDKKERSATRDVQRDEDVVKKCAEVAQLTGQQKRIAEMALKALKAEKFKALLQTTPGVGPNAPTSRRTRRTVEAELSLYTEEHRLVLDVLGHACDFLDQTAVQRWSEGRWTAGSARTHVILHLPCFSRSPRSPSPVVLYLDPPPPFPLCSLAYDIRHAVVSLRSLGDHRQHWLR